MSSIAAWHSVSAMPITGADVRRKRVRACPVLVLQHKIHSGDKKAKTSGPRLHIGKIIRHTEIWRSIIKCQQFRPKMMLEFRFHKLSCLLFSEEKNVRPSLWIII